jgi:hypothetical protein
MQKTEAYKINASAHINIQIETRERECVDLTSEGKRIEEANTHFLPLQSLVSAEFTYMRHLEITAVNFSQTSSYKEIFCLRATWMA